MKLPILSFGLFFVGLFLFLSQRSLTSNSSPDSECANSISCVKDLSGRFEKDANSGEFLGQKVNVPSTLAQGKEEKAVLGDLTAKDKHIFVDLNTQTLHAKEGDREVFSFPISSGKWYPTPTGDFRIWVKLRSTRMSGGSKSLRTYYNLPNVPFVMYFYNDQIPKIRGFGLHGAYWHNNFGNPMSHGCVNISIPNAEKLYNWVYPSATGNVTYIKDTEVSTPVTIYGQAPKEG